MLLVLSLPYASCRCATAVLLLHLTARHIGSYEPMRQGNTAKWGKSRWHRGQSTTKLHRRAEHSTTMTCQAATAAALAPASEPCALDT